MRKTALLLIALLCVTLLAPAALAQSSGAYKKNTALDTTQKVELVIACNKSTWPEMDSVIAKFEKIYPNCSITCEYIEQYSNVLDTRLRQSEHKVDIFRTTNIQSATAWRDCAVNLISEESKKILSLDGANAGLVENFRYTDAENTQYAVPYGGEMRGMYVNITLLKTLGLKVPTNRAELLSCCEALYAAGYVPFQSSHGTFAQQLLYPYICNSIVNGGQYEAMYEAVENIAPGVSEYFRDAYEFLYDIVQKGYFDYARVAKELGYTFSGSDAKAREFLNIIKVSDDEYQKQDDVGKIAFMVDTQGFDSYISKTKSDYHSNIEYKFILSPVGKDGGYAYISPADGLAVNNRSDHIDWSLEFLNFFFTPENSKAFAAATGKVPNTSDALLAYDVSSDHVSNVGQVTFSYPFYKTVTTLMLGGYADDMIGISRMNDPQFMTDNGDGTFSIAYSLEDYMARLEQEFVKIRQAR